MSTPQIPSGYISDVDRVESEMQETFEDVVHLLKELLGGNGENPGTLGATILGTDAFAVVQDYAQYAVDSQGQSGDDELKNITGSPRDGMVIAIRPFSGSRAITVKNGAGGVGQINLKLNRDKKMTNTAETMLLRWRSSADSWYELDSDESFRVDQLMGARDLAALTVSSNAITPDRALHSVTTSGSAQDINTIAQTNISVDGRLLILVGDDPTNSIHVCTLKHAAGGTGELRLRDAADFALDSIYKAIVLRKNGTKWYEVFRTDMQLPTNPSNGALYVGNGAKSYSQIAGTPNNGDVVTWDSAATNKVKWAAASGGAGGGIVNGLRLSASSSIPAPTSDVTGATSIYVLPHKSKDISLYNGSAWVTKSYTGSLSLSLSSYVCRLLNIYAYDNDGTLAIEADPWDSSQVSSAISAVSAADPCVITTSTTHSFSVGDIVAIAQGSATGTKWTDTDRKIANKFFYVSATTSTTITLEGTDTTSLTGSSYTGATVYKIPSSPATGQTLQDGIKCKTGALTRRFLGTIYVDDLNQTNDAVTKRHVSNRDNKELAKFGSEEPAATSLQGKTGFFPRSNSTQHGKTRSEVVACEPSLADIFLVDTFPTTGYAGTAGAAVGVNRMPGNATLSTYQSILECQVGTRSANANYTMIESKSNAMVRALAAGLYFIQHMWYGNPVEYFYGKNSTEVSGQAAVSGSIWR